MARIGDGADVVRDDPHRDLGVGAFVILVSGKLLYPADEAGEDVGVVVGFLALEHCAEALEAHAGVDILGGKRFEGAVGLAVELHEDEVPYLDDERVVVVDERGAGDLRLVLLAAEVYVDLAAGAAGAGVAHLPEVVVLVPKEYLLRGEMLHPGLAGLLVEGGPVLGGAFEDRHVEVLRVYLVDFGQELPCEVYRFGLEVVAEAPVAEHLEHRVVVGVVAYLLEVVVLAADAEALLGIRGAGALRSRVSEEYVLELVHARVRKHERRVVLYNHGGRRDHRVPLGCEVIEEFLPDLFCCHHILFFFQCAPCARIKSAKLQLFDDFT